LKILGIDPGSRTTGYGIIQFQGPNKPLVFIEAAAIKLGQGEMAERLATLFDTINDVVTQHKPDVVAVEQVFVHKSVTSALKLGQARGVAICAAARHNIPLVEYAPRRIKQAVVGSGGAEKSQVGHMIKVLLNLKECPQADAGDALAVALCHAHTQMGYTVSKKDSWRHYDRKTLRETD
tara:strand:+ start:619 stop:1155 length:537 start_codon:yes stop_codon:yes gene_type:complete